MALNTYMFATMLIIFNIMCGLILNATSSQADTYQYAEQALQGQQAVVRGIMDEQDNSGQIMGEYVLDKTSGDQYSMSINIWQVFKYSAISSIILGYNVVMGNNSTATNLILFPAAVLNALMWFYNIAAIITWVKGKNIT